MSRPRAVGNWTDNEAAFTIEVDAHNAGQACAVPRPLMRAIADAYGGSELHTLRVTAWLFPYLHAGGPLDALALP